MRLKDIKLKKEWFALLYIAAVSFVFMLLFSKNSFLYPINNGPDINMFYTMGKGIANGMVCYRDVFDQKGPFLYFVYALAYLIDRQGFLGVFLIEIISFSVFLFFVYRMMKLYKVERFIYIVAPLLAFVTCGNFSFLQGGQVEELVFPLMAYMFFSLLRYFKTDYPEKPISGLTLFFNGICSGMVFWSKFTLITLWFIFMAALFFIMIKNKQIKQAFLGCVFFLAGTMVPTVPILIYFAAKGELALLFKVYLEMNLFGYSTVKAGMGETLKLALRNTIYGLKRISSSLVIALLGFIGFAAAKKRYLPDWRAKLIFPLLFLFLLTGIYIGGQGYVYYPGALIAFASLGAVVLGDILSEISGYIKKKEIRAAVTAAGAVLTFAVCVYGTFDGCPNIHILGDKKEETPHYQFAEIINSVPDSTMLNYGFLDSGFYTAADKLPVGKFFARINLSYEALPEMYDEQRDLVKEGKVDFVIVRVGKDEGEDIIQTRYGSLFKDYEIAAQQVYNNGDWNRESKYFLLRRSDI